MKHAQGEWKISDEGYIFEKRTWYLICDFSKSALSYEEDKANAKLIASAPDLLEALQGLFKICEENDMGCYSTGERIMNQASKALKKATL